LDVVVIDPTMHDVLFQGVVFESWLIDVCALPPARVEPFFRDSAQHRSAPVPHQVVDAIIVRGDEATARMVQDLARQVLREGPVPLSDAERLELRWTLTALLHDLAHAAPADVPMLAAQCHTKLAQAALDGARAWRGDRKALRSALTAAVPGLAERLDQALLAACGEAPEPLVALGHEILNSLGGALRTYSERY
jgi:hypothetical protein